MANNELTYNDFLQRLNIQELLVDAGYQLNKRHLKIFSFRAFAISGFRILIT